MTEDGGRAQLGQAVKAARLALGWGKEKAAREAQVSSITWTRVEDGLTVQDPKLSAVERALGWEPGEAFRVMAGRPYPGPPARDPGRQPSPVGGGGDAAAYVSHPGSASGPSMTDDEVLELVKVSRRLADELERRLRDAGP